MISEVVLSVLFLDKHFCAAACDERLSAERGKRHEGRAFIEDEL